MISKLKEAEEGVSRHTSQIWMGTSVQKAVLCDAGITLLMMLALFCSVKRMDGPVRMVTAMVKLSDRQTGCQAA